MYRFSKFTNGAVTKYVRGLGGDLQALIHQTAVRRTRVQMGDTLELTTARLLATDTTWHAGPFVYTSAGKVAYRHGDGYVDLATTPADTATAYYYLRDHVGSVRAVVRADGTIVQRTAYYPFGGMHGRWSQGDGVHPLKHGGQELDRMHGKDWYLYQARAYMPALGEFTQVDECCEKSYDVSPYAFCHNNPMNRIDPDGRDDWMINRNGRVVDHKENKEHDAFHVLGTDAKESHSLVLPYHTVERHVHENIPKSSDDMDAFWLRGDKNGKAAFEFLVGNTDVEWTHMELGIAGEKGLNVLSSSHKQGEEAGGGYLLNNRFQGGTLRKHIHNHNSGINHPSEMDVDFIRNLTRSNSTNTKTSFHIYTRDDDKYTTYDKNTKPYTKDEILIKDLKEVEITGSLKK